MRGYADTAQWNGVGSPLDGTYASADAIRGTWAKFTQSAGLLKVSIKRHVEHSHADLLPPRRRATADLGATPVPLCVGTGGQSG